MTEQNNPRSADLGKVLITVVPLVLVIIQLVIERQIDVATLGLVAIALLPWLYTLVESTDLPGGFTIRFRLRRLQDEQARQGLELDTLKFLITHFVSMDEEKHLRNLAYHPRFTFDWSKEFEEEMWRLWRRRLIKEKHGDRTLRKMERKEEGDRFEDYFEISAAGSEYLRLREEVDGDRETPVHPD
jgi:hypothetical protein